MISVGMAGAVHEYVSPSMIAVVDPPGLEVRVGAVKVVYERKPDAAAYFEMVIDARVVGWRLKVGSSSSNVGLGAFATIAVPP